MTLAGVSEATTRLVELARDGNRDAFGDLVELHWDRLVRLARSVVGDLEAEDAVQDGLVVAWRKLARLSDPERFGAWASRIVFRRCVRRARAQRGRVAIDEVSEPSHTPDPDARIGVWQILAQLAPRQRAVLHLTAAEGCTDVEIAGLLGITPGSVRAHRRRARESVTRILHGRAA